MNELFLTILKLQSESYDCSKMQDFILEHSFQNDYTIDIDDCGNIYITKGVSDSYPCIVAHMDTVHSILPDDEYCVIHDDRVAMAYNPKHKQLVGIGGDDKVGIYIALRMMQDLDYCKAAFFVDEEVGCHGSMKANMSFFSDARFVLQCDRKGNSDFVSSIFYADLYSDEFSKDILPIISRYGYSESDGGLTDVYQLHENGIGICVANMSCGYYNPHSDDEMISLEDVDNCMCMVYEIMTNCTKVYKHSRSAYYPTKSYGNYGDWVDSYNDTPVSEKWDGWEYDGKKYTKRYDEYCWDCGVPVHSSKYGLCGQCERYHSGISYKQENKII